jgi:hypothetical protein
MREQSNTCKTGHSFCTATGADPPTLAGERFVLTLRDHCGRLWPRYAARFCACGGVAMDEKYAETVRLLRMRAEILDLFDGPDLGRRVLRWLMKRRSGVLIVPPDREVHLRAAATKIGFTGGRLPVFNPKCPKLKKCQERHRSVLLVPDV